ncbi:MAG: hypothetical protein U9Q66_00610 [Patescibacteria group bacterium]|nr:hypothetical protein [Patescibacteria group bacterium]
MSITEEQANCIHDLDDTFRCTKCHMYDSFAAQASEFSFDLDCFTSEVEEVEKLTEYVYFICINQNCESFQDEIRLPSCYDKPTCSDCEEELEKY